MNTSNKTHSFSPIEERREKSYITTIGRELIREVSIFIGRKSASKAIYDAAVKKICRRTASIVMSIFDAYCWMLSQFVA